MPDISVCFASRGRPDGLREAVSSLLDLAAEPDEIEIIVAVDPDDDSTHNIVKPPALQLWTAPERYGYTRLHEYLNRLAEFAAGDWMMWFSDDARMLTADWDRIILAQRPAVLWPYHNHLAAGNIFPAWPRAWSEAMGYVSPTAHMDVYMEWIGDALGRHDRIPVHVLHDRVDLTGNHNDATYAEGRKLLGSEGKVPGFDEPALRTQLAGNLTLIRNLIDVQESAMATKGAFQ